MENIKITIHSQSCFIIAEIGMNHDGSLGNAIRLIEEASDAGVDAVKFQFHIAEEETLPNAPTPPYFKIEGRFDYFNRTSFSFNEWKKLSSHAHKLGLYFIVSPFSNAAVDILKSVNIDAYKIASGETTNIPLLEYINSMKIPVLLSTGMSNWDEINNAVNSLHENLITIFQCTSEYPCKPESVGLNVISEMVSLFPDIPIGFSDHTLDLSSSIAAFMTGAKVFEKHFTLSKKMYGADARFSLEPNELKEYVAGINFVSKVRNNNVDKNNIGKFKEMKLVFEKSIVAARDLEVDHHLTLVDLAFKKPGNGIRADKYKTIIGKKLLKSINKDEIIGINHIQ